MKQLSKSTFKQMASFAVAAILMAGAAARTLQATEWKAIAGAESPDRGSQALAFLPNEFWIHAGDSIRWSFATHERHSLTLLTPGQTRPPGFGPTFGVPVGCPGLTPDGSSFDGTSCVTTGILLLDENAGPTASPLTYSVSFPAAGNFKFVCLVHADMTGVVHVLNAFATLPHDQAFYDQQAQNQRARLFRDAARPEAGGNEVSAQSNKVAAGLGVIVTPTGVGSQTASLMRFVRATIIVQVGDTVEWTNLDPSINHTVTFGTEPADPRPPSSNLMPPATDGARQAIISSPTDSVNSGFLTPTPQDRSNLAQASPNVTRFRVTFTAPGIFNYICAVHDQLGMKGTVVVH